MPAFYRASLNAFLAASTDEVVGSLVTGLVMSAGFDADQKQVRAWSAQIELLRVAARKWACHPDASSWHLLLEYPIPRRLKRIDTVLLTRRHIFVLEFKMGATQVDRAAIRQVEDYAYDLRDFHAESRASHIVPVVIASEAEVFPDLRPVDIAVAVAQTQFANQHTLAELILDAEKNRSATQSVDPLRWDQSGYRPVPSIIEAAQTLFSQHSVEAIAHSNAGARNLTHTVACIARAIREARETGGRIICFVTGIPGSGKTLAGLSAAHAVDYENLAVFLSGNGPLVKVLSEALARNHRDQCGSTLTEARRKSQTFIRNVHEYIRTHDPDSGTVPPDHVVVFDEAQRAWNAEHSKRKFDRSHSEPYIMLRIAESIPDWVVLVALVGGGQEINTGEAGLAEWGQALSQHFPRWQIWASPEALSNDSAMVGGGLFEIPSSTKLDVRRETDLHLKISLRSFKSEDVARWVEAVLVGDAEVARAHYPDPDEFPIVITRSLDQARVWLRHRARGSQRSGLLASAGGLRLRAYGIEVSTGFTGGFPFEEWFLAPEGDVRASNQLEVAATEFQAQGLEIDWAGVCWANDLCFENGTLVTRRFRGSRWQQVRKPQDRSFLINSYRVLLTRARRGLAIWIPPGNLADPTIPPTDFDSTAEFLLECGACLVP